MDAQRTPDRLSTLRAHAEAAVDVHLLVSIDPKALLALIDCADVMRTAYIYLVRDDRAKALKALTVLEQA